jgi:hypothetical protein
MTAIIKVETDLSYRCTDCIFKYNCSEGAEEVRRLLGECTDGHFFQVDDVERKEI